LVAGSAAPALHPASPAAHADAADPITGATPGAAALGMTNGTIAGLANMAQTANAGSATYAMSQQFAPAEQVALAIGRLTDGARSFSMQLNPEQLGAVEVRMDVDAKGKTKLSITADRPETLALLKLDAHHLVRALQESGVTADQGGVSFTLREQGSGSAQDRRPGSEQTAKTTDATTGDTVAADDATPVKTTLSRHLYDIHA
jgi:flagellar hook-length control protein FliK